MGLARAEALAERGAGISLLDLPAARLSFYRLLRQVRIDLGAVTKRVGDRGVDVRQGETREGLEDRLGGGVGIESIDDHVQCDGVPPTRTTP